MRRFALSEVGVIEMEAAPARHAFDRHLARAAKAQGLGVISLS